MTLGGLHRRHPVLEILPEAAARCVETEGRTFALPMGAVLADEGKVRFVVSGGLGVFHSPDSSCVGFVGPGGLHGLDRCFAPPVREHLMALLDAEMVEVPADLFVAATGRVWTERMFAHQATGRLRSMAAEATCSARHTVPHRVARWLLRLQGASMPHRKIQLTQSLLSQVLGVQRTTVNTALRTLQMRGVISISRGAIVVLDADALRDAACACDDDVSGVVSATRLPVETPQVIRPRYHPETVMMDGGA